MIALLHAAPAFGAVERYLVEIAEGLRGRSEEVALVYPDVAALRPFELLSGENIRACPIPAKIAAGSTSRLIGHVARRLRRLRPRIAHVSDVSPPLMVAARLGGAGRLLVTHHTPALPRRDNLAGRAWLRLGWAARPEVIYTSESDRRADRRSLDSEVIHLGIDLERFSRAKPAMEGNGKLVGNVARLAEQKGQRYLVEAAPRVLAQHPDARFVIVGDGELREELEARVRQAGLEASFVFTGERRDVPELLASFDLFALPSLFEGLCYAVIEAQAAGLAVVATPVGGVPENVVPGETGLLCEPRDPASLGEAINQLLDEPERRRHLGDEARRRAFERFSVERMVERTIALYGRPEEDRTG